MHRRFVSVGLRVILAAMMGMTAGCAMFRKNPAYQPPRRPAAPVQPSITLPPPAVAAETMPTAKPRRSWWQRKPRTPRPVRARVTAPAPAESAKQTTPVYRLKSGDPVVIYLRGIPGYPGGQQNIEGILDENGAINLPFLNFVVAAGMTPSELEREIMRRYVEGGYYKHIGVNVIVPTQRYYVRGEVRNPGQFTLTGGVTILQALAAAGGFTEYANKARVDVIRAGKTIRVNVRELEKRPTLDQELQAGDVIIVHRSAF